MNEIIKYPVGINTFSEIIRDNYLYVDKTTVIYTLVKRYKYAFLSRPRRFGKSLLMSTLTAYFKGERDLFKGLSIDNLEKEWESYPVFRFDLSGENFNHPSRLMSHIHSCMQNICEEYSLEAEGHSISDRFAVLIRKAYRRYRKKVVILIEEYDYPPLDCIDMEDVHEEIKAELSGFYSVIKANDEYIKFAMLTGVRSLYKDSLFIVPNNFSDITTNTKFKDL